MVKNIMVHQQDGVTTALEHLKPVHQWASLPVRRAVAAVIYGASLAIILAATFFGYRYQVANRLDERTRELETAYESVISTVAAVPELLYNQLSRNAAVTEILLAGNSATAHEAEVLRRELFSMLQEDYMQLQELDFRQLHFHLRDNRSFLRFHRPERYGDDLTEMRPSIRITNETLQPTYGFEEGRIINGFRYVYPVFHDGIHAGSVEASINYHAVISRMKSHHPVVVDFVIRTAVVEAIVFDDQQENYIPSCFSDDYMREAMTPFPETLSALGVEFSCILDAGITDNALHAHLANAESATRAFMVRQIPLAITLLPLMNTQGEHVAFFLGYSRFDEWLRLRWFFGFLGAILVVFSTVVFLLFLRGFRQHSQLHAIGASLQRTIDAKDRFFSIISHDLRGPMGSLARLTRMLQEQLQTEDSDPADLCETAAVLADGAENAFVLLNDLLDWSRSQRGDITCEPHLQGLHTLVEEQSSLVRRSASQKGITMENRVGTTEIFADTYMIRTVIRNLLTNSVKFTPDGGSISITAEELNHSTVFHVSDTGVGMTPEQMAGLFDPAVRSSSQGTRLEQGTGLGLMVCQEFVHMHGGSISVASTEGAGSTFSVSIPRGAAADTRRQV